ncbi:VIT1/CCC1 transporter family protein [Thermoproteota archaeon]
MRHALKTGFSFGLTSGIITTLGLMVGLNAGTHSRRVVIGGVLTIAIADAFSDALGIHVSEESESIHTHFQIWAATFFTFLSKFIFSLTFVVPIVLFQLNTAIIVSLIWGFFLLCIFSFYLAREQKVNPLGIIGEHLFTAVIVIALTYYVGSWIAVKFN